MDTIAAIDGFFAGKKNEWALCDALRCALIKSWPGTQTRVMKSCISFDDPKPYCYVSYPKGKRQKGLIVTISLREMIDHPRVIMCVPVSKTRCTVHIALEEETQIDHELLGLIALSRR